MALTILGTYPVINKQISDIDDNGIQKISYIFTVKTADAFDYLPLKDDEYYGPTGILASGQGLFDPRTATNRSKYLVLDAKMDNLSGGLTQIMVSTAGTQNINTPPKIRILPNYPLIYGLSGISQTIVGDIGIGDSNGGYGIVMTFITKADSVSEGDIFLNYSRKLMPVSFRGFSLPVPARAPFGYTNTTGGIIRDIFGNITGNTGTETIANSYFGFICKETTFQRIGGITLFQLIYSESGFYRADVCPVAEPGQTAACTTNFAYNF